MKPHRIRLAQRRDVEQIKGIADSQKNELGFVLRSIIEEGVKSHRIYVLSIRNKVAGFIHFNHRKRDKQTTIYQLAVSQRHKGNGIGKALIKHLENEAIEKARDFILLKTPVDLSANKFFRRVGYELSGQESGKSRRLNIWKKTING